VQALMFALSRTCVRKVRRGADGADTNTRTCPSVSPDLAFLSPIRRWLLQRRLQSAPHRRDRRQTRRLFGPGRELDYRNGC
jgi:hypothetical protein